MKTHSRNAGRWSSSPAKAKTKTIAKTNSPRTTDRIEDLEDPFLCQECQKLGYCRLAAENRKKKEQAAERNKAEFVMADQDIRNLVPLNSRDARGKYSGEHLQVAYEAFHQEDYETAILHFMAVLESGIQRQAAELGLAVSHYFMKNHETALDFALRYEAGATYLDSKKEDFIVHCGNCLKKKQAEALEKKKQHEKEADQAVKQLLEENSRHRDTKKSSGHGSPTLVHATETIRL